MIPQGDLSVCSRLKVIYLHKNHIKRIQNIENLSNLTHLYLQWNKIKKIENLGNLKNLKKLYLGNNEISRLENVENLKELEELHLERQNLPEEIIFGFDFKSLESIGKTVKILNISKLNLVSIDSLKPLKRLEVLLASENKFTSSVELGLSLQNLPFLLKAELHGCPAQKEIHYREKITAKTDRLESLDGKSISTGSRSFIKKLEQIKLQRKSKTDLENSSESSLSSKAGNSSEQSFNILDNPESLSFRSWNSCKNIFTNKFEVNLLEEIFRISYFYSTSS